MDFEKFITINIFRRWQKWNLLASICLEGDKKYFCDFWKFKWPKFSDKWWLRPWPSKPKQDLGSTQSLYFDHWWVFAQIKLELVEK